MTNLSQKRRELLAQIEDIDRQLDSNQPPKPSNSTQSFLAMFPFQNREQIKELRDYCASLLEWMEQRGLSGDGR